MRQQSTNANAVGRGPSGRVDNVDSKPRRSRDGRAGRLSCSLARACQWEDACQWTPSHRRQWRGITCGTAWGGCPWRWARRAQTRRRPPPCRPRGSQRSSCPAHRHPAHHHHHRGGWRAAGPSRGGPPSPRTSCARGPPAARGAAPGCRCGRSSPRSTCTSTNHTTHAHYTFTRARMKANRRIAPWRRRQRAAVEW